MLSTFRDGTGQDPQKSPFEGGFRGMFFEPNLTNVHKILPGLRESLYGLKPISSTVSRTAPSKARMSDSNSRPMFPMRKQSALLTLPG